MTSIFKKLFKNKELSDMDILANWERSAKTVRDVERILFTIKDINLIIDEIPKISIKNIKDLEYLSNIINRNNDNNFKRINGFIENIEVLMKIYPDNDYDTQLILLNKYDLLRDILYDNNIKLDKEKEIYLKSIYYSENTYINGIIYAWTKEDDKLLRFFLNIEDTDNLQRMIRIYKSKNKIIN
jgi:hypothetical protein